MARNTFAGGGPLEIVDVNGSFARFVKEAPKVMRQCLYGAIDSTAFQVGQRIKGAAPVGPDSPHIREVVAWKRRGYTAQVGYIEGQGGEQEANPGQKAWNGMTITNAAVAMFYEYGVKHKGSGKTPHPFMLNAAEASASDYVKRVKSAIGMAERSLSGGGGLL